MKRLLLLAAICTLAVTCALAAGPTSLVRIERRAKLDLVTLQAGGLPIVMEFQSCLLLAGDETHVRWLTDHGYQFKVLDREPVRWDYYVVSLRPDSDRAAVDRLGRTLHAEENWVLLQVAKGASIEPLLSARVFFTKVPSKPLAPPQPAAPLGAVQPPQPMAGEGEAAGADPLVQQVVDSVSPAQIDQYWADLTSNPPTGARYSTSQGCRDAAAYCHDALTDLGLPAQYQEWDPGNAPNVIGVQTGAIAPDRVYIVIGHLDDLPNSGPAPGADDNASGVVNVLESARVLSCYGLKNTVKYIACTGEEQGLNGSEAYAADAQARGEQIQGVINMDMIGWEGDGAPDPENLDLNYDANSEQLGLRFAQAATTYGAGLPVDAFLCPSNHASDHYPFWQQGWRAIFGITDNEGHCEHQGHYPHYHQSTDTIANNGDPAFFHTVVRASVATLAELAQPFKITFDRSTYPCTDAVLRVHLADRDLNTNPTTQQTVAVEVWSETETAPEQLVLTEQDVDAMLFSATLPTTAASPVHGDGFLSVASNDLIWTRYVDALDCNGAANVSVTSTSLIDCLSPVIDNVGATAVSDTQATITWSTNEAADGVVVYGVTAPPATSTPPGAQGTTHAIPLTGLTACTVYYYDVRSTDPAGNAALDDNGGRHHHFETLGDFGAGLQACHAGRVTLSQSEYGCASTAQVRVVDIDLNVDPLTAESVTVELTSTSETVAETLLLTETGPATSTFVGVISTDPGTASPDGKLQVRGGDLITATYRDADDGAGAPAVAYATAVADCTGPSLSGLAVLDQPPGRVEISWTTDEPADSRIDYGPTPALGQTVTSGELTTAHALPISQLALCGVSYFKVTSRDAFGYASVEDRGGALHLLQAGDVPGMIFFENFEQSSGWTLESPGEWQIGPPLGLGGSMLPELTDPSTAWSGARVLGNDLSGLGAYPGDYEPQVSKSTAGSPTINTQGVSNVKLLYRRWLGVEHPYSDQASIVVNKNGWKTAWVNSDTMSYHTYDGEWVAHAVDISTYGANNPSLRVGFAIASNFQYQYCGWNVDDVVVKNGALPDAAPCGSCAVKPSFAGLTAATDLSACADSGVALAWQPAAAWGSGGRGTYAVYRDLTPAFAPSDANRIAAGLTGLAYTDASAPNGVGLYYLVRAENTETCSTGPHNGGVMDDNTAYRAVEDALAQPPAADVGPTLFVTDVANTHVRLTWSPAAGATFYNVHRADNAQLINAVVIGTPTATFFEDQGEATLATSRFYLVRGANACGVEGP